MSSAIIFYDLGTFSLTPPSDRAEQLLSKVAMRSQSIYVIVSAASSALLRTLCRLQARLRSHLGLPTSPRRQWPPSTATATCADGSTAVWRRQFYTYHCARTASIGMSTSSSRSQTGLPQTCVTVSRASFLHGRLRCIRFC